MNKLKWIQFQLNIDFEIKCLVFNEYKTDSFSIDMHECSFVSRDTAELSRDFNTVLSVLNTLLNGEHFFSKSMFSWNWIHFNV